MARGPGALGDVREEPGAPTRRRRGFALSRSWLDRFWAALGGGGARGGAAICRGRWASGGVLDLLRVRPGCSLPAEDPPNLSLRLQPLGWGRGSKSCRLGLSSVTSTNHCICPSPHLPSAPRGPQRRFLARNQSGEGAGVYFGGFYLGEVGRQKKEKRVFILHTHEVPATTLADLCPFLCPSVARVDVTTPILKTRNRSYLLGQSLDLGQAFLSSLLIQSRGQAVSPEGTSGPSGSDQRQPGALAAAGLCSLPWPAGLLWP